MQRNLPLFRRILILLFLSLTMAISARAQTTISGKVIASDDNSPVIGASVKLKNAPGGTTTDANGAFALSVSPGTVLVISFVGYQTQEVPVGSRTLINVTLVANKNDLSEVIVTGYTSQRKKDLTGSVSVVNVAELKAQPAASAVQSLQGKAPGVQIVNDGAPGSTPKITIRGSSNRQQ